MATAKKTTGFKTALCPYCMDEAATVTIDLSDLECHCENCDERFSPEQGRDKAAKMLAAWEKVCRWVEAGRQLAAE